MQGSLALQRGTLAVGVQAKTACVRFFDRNGRRLGPGFSFRDVLHGRSAAAGLAVDPERRIWVADTPASRVRCFSLFGREVASIEPRSFPPGARQGDRAGSVDAPVDVALLADDDGGLIAIACGGERRHAVQIFDPALSWVRSLAALGDPRRAFLGVRRVASLGRFLFVVESARRCVQVFREGEFLFAFHLAGRGGERLEPSAIAPLPDGRMLLACGGSASALILLDGAGRMIRTLAEEGALEGQVLDPGDVVIDPGADDRQASIYVIDRDGMRVQVFTLAGRCLGAIPIGPIPVARQRRAAGQKKGAGDPCQPPARGREEDLPGFPGDCAARKAQPPPDRLWGKDRSPSLDCPR